jgi:hypothetical protein
MRDVQQSSFDTEQEYRLHRHESARLNDVDPRRDRGAQTLCCPTDRQTPNGTRTSAGYCGLLAPPDDPSSMNWIMRSETLAVADSRLTKFMFLAAGTLSVTRNAIHYPASSASECAVLSDEVSRDAIKASCRD